MEFINEKRSKEPQITDSSSDISTYSTVKSEKQNGTKPSTFRQSVAIHTSSNNNRSNTNPSSNHNHQPPTQNGVLRPAVGPSQPGMIREMSSELEMRLKNDRDRKEKYVPPPPTGRKPPAPSAPKPVQVSPGIKFNERAEVMEVEKDKREIESETEDSSDDSSSSSDDESAISVTSNEKITRI